MDSVTQFAIGSLFILCLALGGLCAYLAKLLSDANGRLAANSEMSLLASKANKSSDLAEALNQRDQAKADIENLQKELRQSVPIASFVPSGSMDPDTLNIGNLMLDPIRR